MKPVCGKLQLQSSADRPLSAWRRLSPELVTSFIFFTFLGGSRGEKPFLVPPRVTALGLDPFHHCAAPLCPTAEAGVNGAGGQLRTKIRGSCTASLLRTAQNITCSCDRGLQKSQTSAAKSGKMFWAAIFLPNGIGRLREVVAQKEVSNHTIQNLFRGGPLSLTTISSGKSLVASKTISTVKCKAFLQKPTFFFCFNFYFLHNIDAQCINQALVRR